MVEKKTPKPKFDRSTTLKLQDEVIDFIQTKFEQLLIFENELGFSQINFGNEEEKKSSKFNVTNSKLPYDSSKAIKLFKASRKLIDSTYKISAFGPTKGGKSTFFRNLTNMKGFFLSGIEKETSHFWKFKESKIDPPISLTEIPDDVKK